MSLEGSHEIETAKKRLAAAKSQASAATKHKEMIAKLLDSANAMSDAADNEVQEAQKMLADAEKRWEVIEIIDQDPNPTRNEGGSKKRRKVSLSPTTQTSSNNSATVIGSTSMRTSQPNDNAAAMISVGSAVNNGHARLARSSSDSLATSVNSVSRTTIEEILVKGCGVWSVNGTYHHIEGDETYQSAPIYRKYGMGGDFAIYMKGASWYIGNWPREDATPCRLEKFYSSPASSVPPENKWVIASFFGQEPAPSCQLIINNANAAANNIDSGNNNTSSTAATGQQPTANDDEVEITGISSSNNSNNQIVGNNDNDGVAQASIDAASSKTVDEIVVEECGYTKVNGTYHLLDYVTYKDAPVYATQGLMKDYAIYRLKPKYWCIGTWNSEDWRPCSEELYESPSSTANDCLVPPETGWSATILVGLYCDDVEKVPTCRLIANTGNDDNTLSARVAAEKSSATADRSNASDGVTNCDGSTKGISSTVAATSIYSSVDQIVVEECGKDEINGIYDRGETNDGAPLYTKNGSWKGQEVTYTIFREPSSHDNENYTWYIGKSKDADGDYTNKNKALFKSHQTKNGIIPPDGGLMSWTTVSRTRRGVSENGPAPKCRVRNNTANNVELITIEGCGVPEVNGVYMRNGDQSDKVPEYVKRGTWKGSPGIFDIQRGEEYGSSWQIGFLADEDCENPIQAFATFYEAPTSQNNAWVPPKDWEVGWRHDGAQPAPKLMLW